MEGLLEGGGRDGIVWGGLEGDDGEARKKEGDVRMDVRKEEVMGEVRMGAGGRG